SEGAPRNITWRRQESHIRRSSCGRRHATTACTPATRARWRPVSRSLATRYFSTSRTRGATARAISSKPRTCGRSATHFCGERSARGAGAEPLLRFGLAPKHLELQRKHAPEPRGVSSVIGVGIASPRMKQDGQVFASEHKPGAERSQPPPRKG